MPSPRPDWMTTETLLKWAGLVLVVLAAVFFVGTAINRGWIGPEVQLAGATLLGLALIAGGYRLAEENRPWAVALTSGGAVVVPVCAAAANAGLDLIGEYPALAVLAAVTVGLGWVSHRLSMQMVASGSALAAVVLPFWIIEDIDAPALVPAGWLAVLAVAGTAFGWYRGWTVSRLLTVGASGVVLFGLAVDPGDLGVAEQVVAVIAIAVVAVVAWSGPAYPALKGTTMPGWLRAIDQRSVLSVPLWAWGMVGGVVSFEGSTRFALFGLGLAAVFALAVGALWSRAPRALIAAHLLAVGILVASSFAALTDSPVLLVAIAVQAAATAVLAKLFKDLFLAVFAGLLGSIALVWAAQSTLSGLFDRQPVGQLLANVIVLAMIVAWAYNSWRERNEQLAIPLTLLAWLGVLGWSASAFVHQPQGHVIVSLLWAAIAAGALVIGIRRDNQLTRVLGVITLVIVLFKLLTVDLAAVDTLWRVGLFLIVGAGLLRLGYVLPRLSRAAESQLR